MSWGKVVTGIFGAASVAAAGFIIYMGYTIEAPSSIADTKAIITEMTKISAGIAQLADSSVTMPNEEKIEGLDRYISQISSLSG